MTDYHIYYPLHIPPGPPPEQIAEKLAKLIDTARKNPKNQTTS